MTQDDVLFPQLTVEETLVFAALLRLPTNMPKQQKLSRVDTIIKDLNLERLVFLELVETYCWSSLSIFSKSIGFSQFHELQFEKSHNVIFKVIYAQSMPQ